MDQIQDSHHRVFHLDRLGQPTIKHPHYDSLQPLEIADYALYKELKHKLLPHIKRENVIYASALILSCLLVVPLPLTVNLISDKLTARRELHGDLISEITAHYSGSSSHAHTASGSDIELNILPPTRDIKGKGRATSF